MDGSVSTVTARKAAQRLTNSLQGIVAVVGAPLRLQAVRPNQVVRLTLQHIGDFRLSAEQVWIPMRQYEAGDESASVRRADNRARPHRAHQRSRTNARARRSVQVGERHVRAWSDPTRQTRLALRIAS